MRWHLLLLLAPVAAHVRESLQVERAPGVWLHTLIHGEDKTAPLMLVIIGGQGTPVVTFEPVMRPLSRHCVYLMYTMRGVMGLNGTDAPVEQGVNAHVEDALWMATYFSERFGGRPVHVAGLSYGADMALQVAVRAPLGLSIASVVCISGFYDVVENLRLVHVTARERIPRWLMWISDRLGDTHAIGYIFKLYLMGVYGLLAYDCHASWPCIPGTLIGPGDVLLSPFTPSLWTGLATVAQMSRSIASFRDVHTLAPPKHLDVPVYFFAGRHDRMANAEVLHRYRDALTAPVKDVIFFERSTHFVPLEENVEFHHAMRRVVVGSCNDA